MNWLKQTVTCGKSLVKEVITTILYGFLEILFPSLKHSQTEIYKHVDKSASEITFNSLKAWHCGNYQHEPFKKLIWSAKYEYNTQAVEISSELLLDEIIALKSSRLSLLNGNCLLLAIPSTGHFIGERDKDYMQDILKQLLPHLESFTPHKRPLEVIKIAGHVRDKQSSATCRRERIDQAVNKFYVDIALDEHTNIILIDDVITTGSTISDSVRALKKAGARHIHIISLAH